MTTSTDDATPVVLAEEIGPGVFRGFDVIWLPAPLPPTYRRIRIGVRPDLGAVDPSAIPNAVDEELLWLHQDPYVCTECSLLQLAPPCEMNGLRFYFRSAGWAR